MFGIQTVNESIQITLYAQPVILVMDMVGYTFKRH